MSGRWSGDKNACTERPLVRLPQAQERATKGSQSWCPRSDFHVPTPSIDRTFEVKCRGAGFSQLYDCLDHGAVLIANTISTWLSSACCSRHRSPRGWHEQSSRKDQPSRNRTRNSGC
jgi:hypothetical protein